MFGAPFGGFDSEPKGPTATYEKGKLGAESSSPSSAPYFHFKRDCTNAEAIKFIEDFCVEPKGKPNHVLRPPSIHFTSCRKIDDTFSQYLIEEYPELESICFFEDNDSLTINFVWELFEKHPNGNLRRQCIRYFPRFLFAACRAGILFLKPHATAPYPALAPVLGDHPRPSDLALALGIAAKLEVMIKIVASVLNLWSPHVTSQADDGIVLPQCYEYLHQVANGQVDESLICNKEFLIEDVVGGGGSDEEEESTTTRTKNDNQDAAVGSDNNHNNNNNTKKKNNPLLLEDLILAFCALRDVSGFSSDGAGAVQNRKLIEMFPWFVPIWCSAIERRNNNNNNQQKDNKENEFALNLLFIGFTQLFNSDHTSVPARGVSFFFQTLMLQPSTSKYSSENIFFNILFPWFSNNNFDEMIHSFHTDEGYAFDSDAEKEFIAKMDQQSAKRMEKRKATLDYGKKIFNSPLSSTTLIVHGAGEEGEQKPIFQRMHRLLYIPQPADAAASVNKATGLIVKTAQQKSGLAIFLLFFSLTKSLATMRCRDLFQVVAQERSYTGERHRLHFGANHQVYPFLHEDMVLMNGNFDSMKIGEAFLRVLALGLERYGGIVLSTGDAYGAMRVWEMLIIETSTSLLKFAVFELKILHRLVKTLTKEWELHAQEEMNIVVDVARELREFEEEEQKRKEEQEKNNSAAALLVVAAAVPPPPPAAPAPVLGGFNPFGMAARSISRCYPGFSGTILREGKNLPSKFFSQNEYLWTASFQLTELLERFVNPRYLSKHDVEKDINIIELTNFIFRSKTRNTNNNNNNQNQDDDDEKNLASLSSSSSFDDPILFCMKLITLIPDFSSITSPTNWFDQPPPTGDENNEREIKLQCPYSPHGVREPYSVFNVISNFCRAELLDDLSKYQHRTERISKGLEIFPIADNAANSFPVLCHDLVASYLRMMTNKNKNNTSKSRNSSDVKSKMTNEQKVIHDQFFSTSAHFFKNVPYLLEHYPDVFVTALTRYPNPQEKFKKQLQSFIKAYETELERRKNDPNATANPANFLPGGGAGAGGGGFGFGAAPAAPVGTNPGPVLPNMPSPQPWKPIDYAMGALITYVKSVVSAFPILDEKTKTKSNNNNNNTIPTTAAVAEKESGKRRKRDE